MAKQWMETGEITYYRRFVDDIIIIFDQYKSNEDSFSSCKNNIRKLLFYSNSCTYIHFKTLICVNI